jgi:hypothetical protein
VSATESYRYDGGIDKIEVKLPTGRWIAVSRGDVVELLPNEAKSVSVLPGWSKAKPVPTPKPTKATESLEGDD